MMTWGELKKLIEEKGVKDDEVIWLINVCEPAAENLTVWRWGNGDVVVEEAR